MSPCTTSWKKWDLVTHQLSNRKSCQLYNTSKHSVKCIAQCSRWWTQFVLTLTSHFNGDFCPFRHCLSYCPQNKNSFHLLSTYYVAISMLSILQILLTTVLWLMCNYLGQVEPVLFLRSENRSSEGLHNLHKVTQKV